MSGPAHKAATVIWNAWQEGRRISGLPEDCRPVTIADGYRVQRELDALASPRRAWKIAATGAGGQRALGVPHPLAGPLYESFSVAQGESIAISDTRMRTVEGEFGFVLARDLPPGDAPYQRADILSALGAFFPALEVPDTRYDDHRVVGAAQLIADAACAGFFVLGEPVDDYDPDALAAWKLTLTVHGSDAVVGSGGNILGDPIEAVRWLANELAAHGTGLVAGDAVITGAAAAIREPADGLVIADFGSLGSVCAELC